MVYFKRRRRETTVVHTTGQYEQNSIPSVSHTTGENVKEEVARKNEGDIIRKGVQDGDYLLQDVIGTFVSIRDQRRQLEEILVSMKEKEQEAEEALWDMLEAMKLKSVKNDLYGTISRQYRTTPYVTNDQTFLLWVRSTNNYHLLTDRVKMRELREYITQQEQMRNPEAVPPGVEVKIDKVISVRGLRGEENG
jgi:hypothetical protein